MSATETIRFFLKYELMCKKKKEKEKAGHGLVV